MNSAKNALAVAAGLLLALLGPSLVVFFRGITSEKATGFAIVFGGFSEALLSLRLWILGFLFSLLFWAASRLNNKFLRAFLFWTPTTLILAFSLLLVALFVGLRLRSG